MERDVNAGDFKAPFPVGSSAVELMLKEQGNASSAGAKVKDPEFARRLIVVQ